MESAGDKLDLSGAEIGGSIYVMSSKFAGVRIDKPAILHKIKIL